MVCKQVCRLSKSMGITMHSLGGIVSSNTEEMPIPDPPPSTVENIQYVLHLRTLTTDLPLVISSYFLYLVPFLKKCITAKCVYCI